MTLKTIKIKVSFERTFALANYENIKPHYEIEQEFVPNPGRDKNEIDSDVALRIKDLRKIVLLLIQEDKKLFRTKPKK